eukprot:SAG22_NODE_1341_length_4687_cov_1.078030_3_plen_73_part_00
MRCCSGPSRRRVAHLELVDLPPCIVSAPKTKIKAQPGKFAPVRRCTHADPASWCLVLISCCARVAGAEVHQR